MISDYRELLVYQKAYALSLGVYRVTATFPRAERFGLVSQMRRSAVSMPINIAEGYRRKSRKEYVNFLHIAHGSCSELETLLSLSFDLGLIEKSDFDRLHAQQDEVSRMLTRLIQRLNQNR